MRVEIVEQAMKVLAVGYKCEIDDDGIENINLEKLFAHSNP